MLTSIELSEIAAVAVVCSLKQFGLACDVQVTLKKSSQKGTFKWSFDTA